MNTVIPAVSYHDPAVFALEQKKIFGRIWYCIGFRHDVARHNDFICRDVGGQSVVVHNFNGKLRAFHNVCSHRFSRIHSERGGNRPLQCAYHGWTYDEAGLPNAIPKRPRFDDLTPEKICALRLQAWRVELCGSLIFVCRDPHALPLKDFLGGCFGSVERMTEACGPQVDENVMLIRANWKILVENTLESYHVGFIHPNTFSRLNAGEGAFGWQPPHSSWESQLGQGFIARMGKIKSLFESRPLKLDGYFHQLVFPNVTIASTQGTSFSVQFFEPVGPGETRFTSFVFQTRLGEVSPSTQAAVDAMNVSVKDFNRAVFAEDKEICEQVQLGAAETSQTGILSDEELRVGNFQTHYLRMMSSTT
jgi:phenylpropionate dioxygenase-like ring-hydroxylating dioxygenase large terminal subunit